MKEPETFGSMRFKAAVKEVADSILLESVDSFMSYTRAYRGQWSGQPSEMLEREVNQYCDRVRAIAIRHVFLNMME
jgi:hypothetical protein